MHQKMVETHQVTTVMQDLLPLGLHLATTVLFFRSPEWIQKKKIVSFSLLDVILLKFLTQ